MASGIYSYEQISPSTWKIVENDHYGQYPFMYVINGEDKCVLIDTGCGTGNYFELVSQFNKKELPILVICTHVHFDHVGGNHQFCKHPKCIGIYMGNNNNTFTSNYEINSLAMAHHGATVKQFDVSKWLADNELVYLDDANPTKENALEIIHTPGHTPDSIAIYDHRDKRLFIGDTLYPFTAIHVDCIGSNLKDYIASLNKISMFLNEEKAKLLQSPKSQTSKPSPSINVPSQPVVSEKENQFLEMLGLQRTDLKFSLKNLLSMCDDSVEGAIEFYLSNSPVDIESMFPAETQQPVMQVSLDQSDDIMISCGHVEANFPMSNVQKMLDFLNVIVADAIPPVHNDGEYSEYSTDTFTILLSRKELGKMREQI